MAASQGHARHFANPGTFAVAREMLRMDVPHTASGEGAGGMLHHGRQGTLAANKARLCRGLSKEGRAAARLQVLQIPFVGTVVTCMGTVGLGRGGMMPSPSVCCFASSSLCLSSLIHLFLIICQFPSLLPQFVLSVICSLICFFFLLLLLFAP